MKATILSIFFLFITGLSVAQHDRGEKHDKIKALMVSHINNDLNFSSQEAEKFWPMYHTARKKQDDIAKKKRSIIKDIEQKLNSLSDNEAQKLVSEIEALDREDQEVGERLKSDIIKLIGAKRFLVLKNAEMTFRRKMLEEFKDRRGRKGE